MEKDMANFKTTYEWAIEYRDEHGDVEELDHFEKTVEALTVFKKEAGPADLVLVRDTWDIVQENLETRQWAYFENGRLPVNFDGGAKVPERFHKAIVNHR